MNGVDRLAKHYISYKEALAVALDQDCIIPKEIGEEYYWSISPYALNEVEVVSILGLDEQGYYTGLGILN